MTIDRTRKFAVIFSLSLLVAIVANLGLVRFTPALSQSIRSEAVSQKLYQSLDFLPLENSYQSQRTGETEADNTLMLRFLRYHEYVKSRPLTERFDWQLTFADYFGVNEPMKSNRYPGHRNLTANPLEKDREIVASWSRDRRNQIIDTLLAIYNPQEPASITEPSSNSPEKPVLPQPGSAELLLPLK